MYILLTPCFVEAKKNDPDQTVWMHRLVLVCDDSLPQDVMSADIFPSMLSVNRAIQ